MSLEEDFIIVVTTVENTTNKTTQYLILERYYDENYLIWRKNWKINANVLILQNFVVGRKCRALYDCEADNEDELTFEEGDIIVVINEDTEDENWMEGCLLSDPSKRGLFPVSFVNMVEDSWNHHPSSSYFYLTVNSF